MNTTVKRVNVRIPAVQSAQVAAAEFSTRLPRCRLISRAYTVKICVYPHGYCVASFPYFNGTGSVYVCIRKSTE